MGQSWQNTTGANLQLSPNGQTGDAGTASDKTRCQPPVTTPDSANKPQEIAFSGVWDLPIGKGRRFGNGVTGVARQAAQRLAHRLHLHLYLRHARRPARSSQLLRRLHSLHRSHHRHSQPARRQHHWFNNNPTCYANFPTQSINNGLPPRFSGNVENPATPQLNIAIEKNTSFKERYKLTFRAEAFNLTNTPILSAPADDQHQLHQRDVRNPPQAQSNFPRFFQLAMKLYF